MRGVNAMNDLTLGLIIGTAIGFCAWFALVEIMDRAALRGMHD